MTDTIDEFRDARRAMVDEQIAVRGVTDPRVLAAMAAVPRERFVPDEKRAQAFADNPLPIGEGQTISQPYIVAYMTEQLNLRGDERVLEVGAGCGYQSAVLARLCRRVYAIEYFPSLAESARRTWRALGLENIDLRVGDGSRGWPEEAPFDAILVAAAAPVVPEALLAQLTESGRAILPVGDDVQHLVRFEKSKEGIREERLIPVRFVPLLGVRRASPIGS